MDDKPLVLCDTHDTSILIVDNYATIPVAPSHNISQYIVAVQNTVKWHKCHVYCR